MVDFELSKRVQAAGQAESSWSQGLLTLISIILGAAVAVSAQRIFDLSTGPTGFGIAELIHTLTLFMFVTGTFYHTYTVVSFYFIIPNILWVMIPTAVGIGVVMSAYAIGSTKYFLVSATFFYFFGATVFIFALIERHFRRIGLLAHDEIDAKYAYRVFFSEMSKNAVCFCLMLIATVALYFLCTAKEYITQAAPELVFVLINGTIYTVMVATTEIMFLPKVREIWKLDQTSHISTD